MPSFPHIDVLDHGADPTGVTDSTQAIQAAIDVSASLGAGNERGGIVWLGKGKYKITDTIFLHNGNSQQYGAVQLIGESTQTCWLQYEGPNDRAAVFSDRQANAGFGNFTVNRAPSDKGTSIGIHIGAVVEEPIGTMSVSLNIKPVAVSGFRVGVQCGDQNGAACSEVVFDFVQTLYCAFGVVVDNYNTLNVKIGFLNTGYCDYGFYTNTGACVRVCSGAAVRNAVADFRFGTIGRSSINQIRTEACRRLAIVSQGGVAIRDCMVTSSVEDHDGTDIEVYGPVEVSNCHLLGGIAGWGQVSITDSDIVADQWLYPKPGESSYFAGSSVTVRNSSRADRNRETGRWIGLLGGGLRMVESESRDGVKRHDAVADLVSCSVGHATVGGAALTAGEVIEADVVVEGAEPGSVVNASPVTQPAAGLVWSSYLKSYAVASVRVANVSNDSVTMLPTTFRVEASMRRGTGAIDMQRQGTQHYETPRCASNPGLSIGGTTPFTVSAWVLLRNTPSAEYGKFVSKIGEWDLRISHPTWNQGRVRFGMSATDGTTPVVVYAEDFGTPHFWRWYRVVGTYDGTTIRCYVDEHDPADAVGPSAVAGSDGEFCLGSSFFDGPYPTVRLGPVGFWRGRALSPVEVTELPIRHEHLDSEQKQDLVSWWQWDQMSHGLPPFIDWADKHGSNVLSAAVPIDAYAFDPVSAVGPT